MSSGFALQQAVVCGLLASINFKQGVREDLV
jgi:hypothetical protein